MFLLAYEQLRMRLVHAWRVCTMSSRLSHLRMARRTGDEAMITLHIDVPYASFRKSFARSFAETYPMPPPATVYGMLLSLVGERFRRRHEGVRLAFAYKRLPRIATTLRKLSRYKYGVPSKQSKLGNAPDFIETLCGIEFLCWLDSSGEKLIEDATPGRDGRN